MNSFTDNASMWGWEKLKDEHLIPDLKVRTDTLNAECTTLQSNIDTMKISNESNINIIKSSILSATDDITSIYNKLADMQITLNAILLKETSVITEVELRTIYKMLVSPDKENKLVAEEAISNKLKELE